MLKGWIVVQAGRGLHMESTRLQAINVPSARNLASIGATEPQAVDAATTGNHRFNVVAHATIDTQSS